MHKYEYPSNLVCSLHIVTGNLRLSINELRFQKLFRWKNGGLICLCTLTCFDDIRQLEDHQYVWVIDQVWGQDGWILTESFFCVFMERDGVNKGFIIWLLGKFFLREKAGSPERATWLHLARSGSQSQRRIWFILPARGASHTVIR